MMRRLTPTRSLLRTMGLALLLGVATLAGALEARQPAPDVDLGGGQMLSSLKGKVVYIDFWASWCAPCRQSFPWMNDMQKRYGAQGLVVVGINVDDKRQDADEFLAQLPAEFKVSFDPEGDTARRFGVRSMPTSVLVGADGKVVRVQAGFRVEQSHELEDTVAGALVAHPK